MNIYIIANAALGPHMSGGDRIFIECARHWAASGHNVTVFVWEEGMDMCRRNNLSGVNYVVWPAQKYSRYGFMVSYFMRTLIGARHALKMKPAAGIDPVIYSSSDFWPDSIPAFLMHLKLRRSRWIAGFYLFAPGPCQKDSPYRGKRWLTGLFYWLTQLPVYYLVKKYANMVFITSEPDIGKFITGQRDGSDIIVIRGGIDFKPSAAYLSSGNVVPFEERKYDICFVGRFHFQKGILELADIFKLVHEAMPEAKMAVIGAGPLEDEFRRKVRDHGLENKIDLLGFMDGEEKYQVFKQSKVIVHPATYDSGGMAACEAMAWGLPGVSFDLDALKTYYPKGMIKTPCFDVGKFADNILKLLQDKELYMRTSQEAVAWAKEWDWDRRADEIMNSIIKRGNQ